MSGGSDPAPGACHAKRRPAGRWARNPSILTPLARSQAVTKGSEARPRIFVSTNGPQMTTAKKQTAFNRALTPSAELAAVIGATPQPRTEVVKLMWEYIKANNLQNPKNKRNILADAKLKAVFGKDEVTMFEMTGLVGKHLS
nr:SWIB/MDM2 domain-containing protein [Hydrogenophaga sp. Root209]